MLFIVAICLILFLSSCESDAPMEILNGLEAEDLVLEELKEETHQVVKINDVYSYSLTIETIEQGEGYFNIFRLYKNQEDVKRHVLAKDEYLHIENAWAREDILYFAVTYSASNLYIQYILELDLEYNARIIGLPENALWTWDKIIFKDEFYLLENVKNNTLTMQCFSYSHQLLKEIQFEFDNPNQSHFIMYLKFLDVVEGDIYFILHKALIDQDEYYLYRYSDELILLDIISKPYTIAWELHQVCVQNEEFHFYIHEYERQFMADKTYHILYEYSRGILRKSYTFSYQDRNYRYSLRGISYSEEQIYLLFLFTKGGWLAPTKFIIFHYNRVIHKTTYLYSGLSILDVYIKEEEFYIKTGDKVYRFVKDLLGNLNGK